MTTANHQILVIGGGTADIAVAARLLAKHRPDIAVCGGRIVLTNPNRFETKAQPSAVDVVVTAT